MTIFDVLAERRIADALQRGELDDLPGAGMPLNLEEEPFVGPEQRNANRILKNAGFAPRALSLRHSIASLRAELATLPEGAERAERRQELARLLLLLAEQQRSGLE